MRDYNYVDDVVDAMLLVANSEKSNGAVYNLGASEIKSLEETAKILVGEKSGEYELIAFPEDRKKIDIGDYYTDYSKIKDAFEWDPKVSLSEGLKRSVDYYRSSLEKYL